MKILIAKSYGIGNAIMATPMIRALHKAGHEVHLLCDGGPLGGPVDQLLEGYERLASITVCKPNVEFVHNYVKRFHLEKFDLVVNSFPCDSQFNWLVPFIHCEYRKPLSISSGWTKHESEYNLDLVKDLILDEDYRDISYEIPRRTYPAYCDWAFADLGRNYVAICPCFKAEGLWWKKDWGWENFATLMNLLPSNYEFILIGSGDDIDTCNKIVSQTKSRTVSNLAGKLKIQETVAVLDRMDLVVANDCGPAHIAAALNKNLITLFGPTSEIKNKPNGSNSIVLKTQLPCSPCQGKELWTKCLNPICLSMITPDMVAKVIVQTFEEV